MYHTTVSHYPTTTVKMYKSNGFSWYLVFILRCPLLFALFSLYSVMEWNNTVYSTRMLLPGLLSESEVVDSGLSDELLWSLFFVFLFGLLPRDRERELELELVWRWRAFPSVLLWGLLLRWESDEYEDDDELRFSLLFLLFLWADSGDEDELALDLSVRLLTELLFFSRILVETPMDIWLSI